ncbi:ubiquitin carboxyl-terminal hydrolase 50-like [Labrus bergylta]|uniref:ubiquitin carboxyl-terminal hydrolase 50-like n=1 Tax=Labrus bergylta TaxID=56723 RepID=UPI0033140AE5
MYKLCGIVNHMGSLKGGHYTATILSKEDNTWCEFNDSHVRKLEEQPFADSQTYNSSTAYLLVYRECTSSTNILKKPPCIALIVCGGLLLLIPPIILLTLNLS